MLTIFIISVLVLIPFLYERANKPTVPIILILRFRAIFLPFFSSIRSTAASVCVSYKHIAALSPLY